MAQQNLYDENLRYFRWILNNFNKVFSKNDLIPLLIIPIAFLIKSTFLILIFHYLYFHLYHNLS